MSRPLRVAAYNVHRLKDDVEAVVRVIRALDPDVLLLQEAPRHPLAGHRLSVLAARCGMYWTGRYHRSSGTTLFTSLRLDVRGVIHEPLPTPLLGQARGYAVARVRLPGHHEVTCVSVHLGLDQQERVRHAEHILGSRWCAGEGPLVVGGDLNEFPDGPAWALLARRVRPVTPDRPTFGSRRPRHRIDAVFASPHLQVATGTATPLDGDDLAAASDHLPVWVDLAPVVTPGR